MAMLNALGIDRHAHGLERQAQRLRNFVPGTQQGGRGGRGRRQHGAHSGARGPFNYHNGADTNDEGTNDERGQDQAFAPPVDIFNHATNWTVHVALPGARKEDIAVNWDAERSHLAISGIVHRPGNEEFLRGLVSGERRVGLFERHVKLPPDVEEAEAEDGAKEAEEDEKEGEGEVGEMGPKGNPTKTKDEVDADGITARMEDGVLIVLVPKIEKEWTQVRKVDIQ
jgi:HSP20 family protein